MHQAFIKNKKDLKFTRAVFQMKQHTAQVKHRCPQHIFTHCCSFFEVNSYSTLSLLRLKSDELERCRRKSIKIPSVSESNDSRTWSRMVSGLDGRLGREEVSRASWSSESMGGEDARAPCAAHPSRTGSSESSAWKLKDIRGPGVTSEKAVSSTHEVIWHTEWRRTLALPTALLSDSYSATGVRIGML